MNISKILIDDQIHFYEVCKKEKIKEVPINNTWNFHDFKFDLLRNILTYQGNFVRITTKQFKVLYALCKRNGDIVSEQELLMEIWGDTQGLITKAWIYAHLYVLRKLFGSHFILNTPKKGYCINLNYEPRIKTKAVRVA